VDKIVEVEDGLKTGAEGPGGTRLRKPGKRVAKPVQNERGGDNTSSSEKRDKEKQEPGVRGPNARKRQAEYSSSQAEKSMSLRGDCKHEGRGRELASGKRRTEKNSSRKPTAS